MKESEILINEIHIHLYSALHSIRDAIDKLGKVEKELQADASKTKT